MHRTRSTLTYLLCLALAAAAPALLAVAILVGSTPDEEEFRFAVLATTLHVRALADGAIVWWSSVLGLGVPQPLVPNFHMHPLAPLLAVLWPGTWVRVLYFTHTVLGAVGMWRVAAAMGLGPLARAVGVFSFLLATPTQNYLLTDFWPSHYLVWTSAPWLLLFAWRVLEAEGKDLWRWSLALGLAAGLVLANTNPGHVVVYGTIALTVTATRWRALVPRWRGALLAAAVALAISGPNHLQLAIERATFFDPSLGIEKYPEPLSPSAAWDLFLRPISESGDDWDDDVRSRGTRTVFFGGPFAALAIAGLWFGRAHLDLVFAAIFTAALLFTPFLPITFASRFHFRDPLALCAILLAGVVLQRLLRVPRLRPVAAGAVVLQVAAVGFAVWPFASATWTGEARQAMWYYGATGETEQVDRLLSWMREPGRLVYSPQVDYEVSQRGLLREGLGVNALAYRGVRVVNGSFKGVSTDELWPDDRLFYGRIAIPPRLVGSDAALDLLGIRYVLGRGNEPVAPGLVERGRFERAREQVLVLYENPDVGPGAFAVPADAVLDPPLDPECGNDRLFCRDFESLAQRRLPAVPEVTRRPDTIEVTLPQDAAPRLLIVAEMFRPAWTAAAGDASLPTESVGPGLLGVRVPPGVTSVRLRYRPVPLILANVLAWTTLAGALAGTIVLSRPRAPRMRRGKG